MIQFYIRRYNDIDHTIPIVYKFARDGYKDIQVVCLNFDIDIYNDIRIIYIQNAFNISFKYVIQTYTPTILYRLISFFICGTQRQFKISSQHNKEKKIVGRNRIFKNIFIRNSIVNMLFFNKKWAFKMLAKNDVKAVIFDWQKPNSHFTKIIKNTAKCLSIPIVAVPHGISCYTNDNWIKNDKENIEFNKRHILDDKVIVQFDSYKKKLIDGGVQGEKIIAIGSTRFCSEWRNIYINLILNNYTFKSRNTNGKLKIVYMDHNPYFRIIPEKVYSAVKRIIELDYVDLIIKPSTGKQERMLGGLSSNDLLKIAQVDYSTNSISLIDWADVVIGTTSSILLEPLLMNKIFIYPKYLHENSMMWEEYEACWIVHTENELIKSIDTIYKNPGYKPYSDEAVEKLIREVVYNNIDGLDVLKEYRNIILNISNKVI